MGIEKYIDQTLLKQDATEEDIVGFCEEAAKYNFRSVCIPPCFVGIAKEILDKTPVSVCSVVGFPHGNTLQDIKLSEINYLSVFQADEVDVVWNIGDFKNRESRVIRDLEEIATLCRSKGLVSKCIVETCLLDEEEKLEAFWHVYETGFDFIKTSTGFSSAGAKLEDVLLWNRLRREANAALFIKASAGIRDLKTALSFIDAGADVLGTSHGVKILQEEEGEETLSSRRDRKLCKEDN